MYQIVDKQFADDYGNDTFLYDWPIIYLLENGRKAYIGQSTNDTLCNIRDSFHHFNLDVRYSIDFFII